MPILGNHSVICGDIEVVESIRTPCTNKEYGCNEIIDYTNSNHEETCLYAPCGCPIFTCNFVGSSKQLSLHFSGKHWDSGRRFRYNTSLTVSLPMNEEYLILQAEDDGMLFRLNKGVESIGNTVTITCIAPCSSKEKYMYDLSFGRGISSLRLKSVTENFPGRVEGFPSVDFLLVPNRFLGSSGELNLDICVWNSTDFRVDCL